jgi:hypothetical protein
VELMGGQTFQPGEYIAVSIAGARVSDRHTHERFLFLTSDAVEFQLPVKLLAEPGVTVTRLAPFQWPPRPGDLWQDAHGARWLATGNSPTPDAWMLSGEESACYASRLLQDRGPLQLLFRDPPDDEEYGRAAHTPTADAAAHADGWAIGAEPSRAKDGDR